MDELPYSVVLYRGEEGEVFMGDDVEMFDCPLIPTTFSNMIVDILPRGIGYMGADKAKAYNLAKLESKESNKDIIDGSVGIVANDVIDFDPVMFVSDYQHLKS